MISSSEIGEYNFDKKLKDLLQKQGYDGIIFNDFQVSVFEPNQIKSVKNARSWTDSKGNISNAKPKDKNSKHSYFNENTPNIYHSSSTAGGGVLGGTIAGVERDEEGNIVSFSPQKFALGFASGAAGAKALSSNFSKKYAKIANQKIKANLNFSLKNIAKNNKNFILQNPQGFIQELDKKSIRELLESKGNIRMSVGDGRQSLASEVANALVSTTSKNKRKR